jgi:hypothetical protein
MPRANDGLKSMVPNYIILFQFVQKLLVVDKYTKYRKYIKTASVGLRK